MANKIVQHEFNGNPIRQLGVVVPPIDTISLKSSIHRAMGNLRTIARYTDIDPVQNHNLFSFSTVLTKIAAKQIEKVTQEKSKAVFDAVYALTAILLDDEQLSGMLPTDLQNLSVTFQTLNEKAQHVLIEDDDITGVTTENDDDTEVKLEDDEDEYDVYDDRDYDDPG